MTEQPDGCPHVVVLGGGLAGVACAHELGDEGVAGDAGRPQRLPPVPAAALPGGHLAAARRGHRPPAPDASSASTRRSRSSTGEVAGVDLADRSRDARRRRPRHAATHLVIAAGAPAGLLRRARRGRARLPALLGRRRRAAAAAPPGSSSSAGAAGRAATADALDVVVVGGGPTGRRDGRRPRRADRTRCARLGGSRRPGTSPSSTAARRCSAPFSEKAHTYAHKRLTKAGRRDPARAPASRPCTPTGSSSTTAPDPRPATVVWGGGESAATIVAGRRAADPDAAAGSTSQPDLTVDGLPAASTPSATSRTSRGTDGARRCRSSARSPSSPAAGRPDNILRELRRASRREPFRYKDKGIMAMIGRNAAVAEVGKHRHQVEGPVAFAAWLGVHAMLLSGAHSKTDAFLDLGAGTTSTATTPPSSRARRRRSASPGATTRRTCPHIAVDARLASRSRSSTPEEDSHGRPLRRHHRGIRRRRRHAGAPARAVGQAGADPGARRLAARESRRTGTPRRSSSTTATCRPTPWYDGDGKPFQPQVHYFVGGATKFYGAALYRLRERDFGELKHHGGISPAWPIGYDVMEPYYTQAEQLYQVHGARGEDPTEPPASAPYPFPPVSHEPRIQQLFDDMAAVGLHPFHSPVRRHARRGAARRSAPASGARPATGSRAWSTPSPTPTSSRCGRRSSTTT